MNALSQQERKNALLATMRGQMPEEVGNFDLGRTMDALNRGVVAGTVGGPVDLATMLMQPFGYSVERPVGGSEWIGQKMQDYGMVSANRDPLTETIASFADPVSALGAFAKAAKAMPAVAGIFAGKNAKLADLLKLQEAEQMLARGDNAADVWRATGWGKGPDGHWRFEIPDHTSSMNLTNLPENPGDFVETSIGKALNHPRLYSSYPEAKEIHGAFTNTTGETGFNMGGYDGMIGVRGIPGENMRGTTLHELQHAIQEREGFSRGGSPFEKDLVDYATTLAKEINAKYAAEMSPYKKAGEWDKVAQLDDLRRSEVDSIFASDKNGGDVGGMLGYRSLAGEAEARLTQSRIPLTQDERLSQYPWDAEYFQQATGVPVNKLIYRYDGGPAASVGDYRGEHVAPMKDSGAPLHDLTGGGSIYPEDVYSTKAAQYYGDGNPLMDRQSFAVAHSVKGNPNAKVTMFRAVPKEITPMEELAALEKHMNQYLRRDRVPKEAQNGLEGSAWLNDAYERRAKLEALIESYQPKDSINSINNGDWVTINRQYAKDHGESALNGKYKIISKKVPARKLYTNGDSIHEWGYDESGFIDPRLLLGLGAGAGAGLYYGGKDE